MDSLLQGLGALEKKVFRNQRNGKHVADLGLNGLKRSIQWIPFTEQKARKVSILLPQLLQERDVPLTVKDLSVQEDNIDILLLYRFNPIKERVGDLDGGKNLFQSLLAAMLQIAIVTDNENLTLGLHDE